MRSARAAHSASERIYKRRMERFLEDRRIRRAAGAGSVATVCGLLLAVLAIPPDQWAASLRTWADQIRPLAPYLLGLVVGSGLTALIFRSRMKKPIKILDVNAYVSMFRRDFDSRQFDLVKIFGYTGEVVGNDLIRYEDKYRTDVEIRLLHRNWLIERSDEDAHNAITAARGVRPWRKWKAIRDVGTQPWLHALRRNIRYYSHQPIVKGALLRSRDSGRTVAYLGFLQWQQDPTDGGSQFKSVPSPVIRLDSGSGRDEAELIERLESQFEYEWRRGSRAEDLVDQETAHSEYPDVQQDRSV